jgi:GTP-binding protein
LAERPWVIVANKMDLPGAEEMLETLRFRFSRVEIIPVSGSHGEGVESLKVRLGALVKMD